MTLIPMKGHDDTKTYTRLRYLTKIAEHGKSQLMYPS